jgi:ankyrin repeat protein
MEEFGTPMFQSGTSTLGKINESVLEQTVYNICNDIIALANLKQLVPFLVQHNFLTPSEQDYLSDDRESSSVRIRRQLVPLLVRGGADALATFYACVVAASDGHPGHVTLARKMRFEFYSELSQLERREVFHSSYVERGPCFEPYKHTQDMFDRNHQVILLLGKKLKKHIGDDLRYGKLQQLAMHIGMTYDIGLHIMETYSPHEYYDKVIEYFLNGMCSGEATVMHLILTLVKLKGMGRLLCHVCDLWGFAPSFYSESLARCLSGDWPALARHLGYTEKEIGNIQEVNGQDFQRQSQAFLKMWKIPDCGPHTWDVIYYAFYYANLSHVLDSSLPEITVAKSELYFSLAAAQSVVRLDSRRKTPGIRRAPNAVKLRKNLVPLLPVPKAGKLRKSSLIVFHENIVPSKPDETREGLLPDPFREKDGSASLSTPDVKPFNSVPHNKDSPSIEPLKVNVNSPVTVATTLPEDPENDVIPVQDFQSSDTNDKVVRNVSKGSGSPIFSHYSAHQQPDSEHSTPMFNQGTIAELAMNLFDVAKEDGKMQGSTLSADTTCQLVRLPESEPVAAHHDKRQQMSLPIPCIEGKEIFTNELNSTELVSPISPVERTAEAEVLVEENVNTEAFTPDHLASGFPGSGDYDTGEYSSLDTLQEPSVFPQVEEEMTSVASEQSFRPTSFQRPLRQQSYPEHETDKVFISAVDNLTSNLILRNEVHFPVFIDDMEHHRLFTRSSPPSEQIKTSSSEFLRALSVPTDVDTELVMTLLDSGADLSVKDERGVQPLHHAAIRGLYDVVKAMICKGVDLDNNCTNDCGWTPLGGACFHGKFEVVDLLLEHGANPNKLDFFGRNCLLLASVLKNERILAKFLDCGADINMKANVSNVTPLALACLLGEVDTCKLLLERGANPCGHSPSETGTSPLLAAVYSQNLELVKLLINHNAHVDTVSSSLFTPLHMACLLRNFGIVQILVDHRASVNCKAEDGETPLMCAVTSGAVDIVELLLRRGANPFLDRVLNKELSGVLVSTLGEAALCGHVDVFEVLMEYDADVNYTDKGVVSVLALACVGGSEDIIDYLLKTNEIDLSCGRSMELSVVLATKTGNAKCLDAIVEKVGLENLWRYTLEGNRALMKNALTPYHCNLVQSLSETPTAKQTEETEGQVHNNPSSSHHVHVSNDLSEPNDPSETSRVDVTTAAGVSVNVSEQSQQSQVPSRFNDLLKDTTSRSEQKSSVEQADEGSGSFQQLGMSLEEQAFDHFAQSYHPRIHIRSAEEGKRLVSLLRFLIIAAGDINDLVSEAIDTGIVPAVEFLTGYFGQKYDEDQSLVQYLQRDGQSQEVLSFIVRKSFSIERLLELSQGLDHHLAHEHFKKLQQHMEEGVFRLLQDFCMMNAYSTYV